MRQLHKMLVLWLVLAYTGQALAGAFLSCPSMAPASAGTDPHAGHHMPAADIEVSTVGTSCCDGGQCSMSQCQASPALTSSILTGNTLRVEARAQRGAHTSPISPTYPLFKPPISL